jgi:hypothetical protein
MYNGFYQKMLGRLLAIHTILNQTVARGQALRLVQMLGQPVNIRGPRICLFCCLGVRKQLTQTDRRVFNRPE